MSGAVFIIAGTDTDIGKTVFAAALTGALGASYWKPIQAGFQEDGAGDKERVARLSGVPAERILPEAYRLKTPCSPHQAAEIDGIAIDPERLELPQVEGPLVVEMAGGLMVPITREITFLNTLHNWTAPVILVARTSLGTINHTLLSLEALRTRQLPVLGIAFVGNEQSESERVICDLGKVRRLGRLPLLDPLDRDSLARAFAENFDLADFRP